MFNTLAICFITSLVATLFVLRYVHKHSRLLDSDVSGVQKFHKHPVPRVGGVSVYFAFLAGAIFSYLTKKNIGIDCLLLGLSASFAFGGGVLEDITKDVSPRRRLLLTTISAIAAYFLLDAAVVRLGWAGLDNMLPALWLSLPLTIFAVAGVTNAINIIDGFNGLASVVVMFMLVSVTYVAFEVADPFIIQACLITIGAIAGFFVWNYPRGLIFLGDGGAYFIGVILAELVVLLVARNPQVSPWYAMLLLIYPVFETFFSIYRKKFLRKMSPSMPDGVHLHMLIFKRMVRWAVGSADAKHIKHRNALTSPYLWVLSLMAVLPATIWWHNQWVLCIFTLLFIVFYITVYWKIVRFKTPKWLIIKKH